MILELAGGEVASDLVETPAKPYPNWTVSVSHEKIEKVLGISVSQKLVEEIFKSLELSVALRHSGGRRPIESGSKKDPIGSPAGSLQGDNLVYEVTVPTFRNDLRIEEDLIEEVGRIIGYNSFPKTLPAGAVPIAKIAYAHDYDFDYEVKQILKGAGYSEIYSYSLISENQLTKLEIDPAKTLRVDNPISKEYEYLRPRMIGNLLEAFKLNQANFSDIRLYELGKHYTGETCDKAKEEFWLSSAQSGEKFYEVKGLVEKLLANYNINCEIKSDDGRGQGHPGRSAIILNEDELLGYLGEIHPNLLAKFGIKGHVSGFTINFDLFKSLATKTKTYQPPSLYPPIIEDLTLEVPENILYGQVLEKIRAVSKLIVSVELVTTLDRNLTFRITYQDKTKNLTDKDVEPLRKKLKTLL